jgi:hypothetical protein
MDTKSFDAIKDQLLEQQAKLTVRADKLRAELAGLDDDRGRIDAALAALSGVDLPSANGKKKHEKRKTFAPSATKVQVVALIAEALSHHQVMQEEELRTDIEKKLVDSGHSRLGYKLRFREALSDSQFRKTTEGIQIK